MPSVTLIAPAAPAASCALQPRTRHAHAAPPEPPTTSPFPFKPRVAAAGSQVCNLSWAKNVNELVSTHGYSQNQIVVWKYPTMQKLATLTGHTYRVLYLAASPDGETIVTGTDRPRWCRVGWQAGSKRGVPAVRQQPSACALGAWRDDSHPILPLRYCSLPAAGAGDETLRFWNIFPGSKSAGSGAEGGMASMMRTTIR